MKKVVIFAVSLCVVFGCGLAYACTEDCNKECDYKTNHAEEEIINSCKESAELWNRIAVVSGNKTIYGDEWINQCVIDTEASYRQDCMEGCDKCKDDKDFLGGCFIESSSSKNEYAR